jgi:hypothetical protein
MITSSKKENKEPNKLTNKQKKTTSSTALAETGLRSFCIGQATHIN